MWEIIREEKSNLQGEYFEQVKSFIRKEIIRREEICLTGRGDSVFDNFLQGEYCTVYKTLLLGENNFGQKKRVNMLVIRNILIENYSDRKRFVIRKIIGR